MSRANDFIARFCMLHTSQPYDVMRYLILRTFEKLSRDRDRVNFAYGFFSDSGVNETCFPRKVPKSNEKALRLRERGNEMFRLKQNLKALILYTKSIAYAENDSCHLGLAYANRSAVLFTRGYFKECLEDIDRALHNNYPDDLKTKLEARRARAELIENPRYFCYYNPPPVISNRNPRISAAADCIELKQSDTHRARIVATRDIKAGETISVEKPYAKDVLNSKDSYLHCHECLDVCFTLIPCNGCTLALYCSAACKEQAFTSYHRYECDFGSSIDNLVSLRTTLLCISENGYQDIASNDTDELYRSDRYKEIHSLNIRNPKDRLFDNFIITVIAGLMFNGLQTRTDILKEHPMDEELLKEIILRNVLVEHNNAVVVEKVEIKNGRKDLRCVGNALYALTSQYRHSCAANCSRTFHGTTSVVRAVRDIKAGEECTISYMVNYVKNHRLHRLTFISNNFHFTCTCIACERMWPTHLDASVLDIIESLKNFNIDSGCHFASFMIQLDVLLNKVGGIEIMFDTESALNQCFNLQKLVVEPSPAFSCIHNLILEILLRSGNRVAF